MAMSTKKLTAIAISLSVVGFTIGFIGFYLDVRASANVNLQQDPIATGNHIKQVANLASWLMLIGNVLCYCGAILFVYLAFYRWFGRGRKDKSAENKAGHVSETWFCPNCGNLDIQGSDHCSKCGLLLPDYVLIQNGRWSPVHESASHKVAVKKH